MTRTTPIRTHIPAATIAVPVLAILLAIASTAVASAQTASRFLGSITAINGSTLTVKTDAGQENQVAVPATAALKRIEPGQKDLSSAAAIAFTDLAVGDRVLVLIDPATASANPPSARQIIAIKAADVAQKQAKDQQDWQQRGVGGIVKNVDAASGAITITTGAGPTAKTVVVNTTSSTVLKRYAPGSVRFDQAQPAPIAAIHPGDQLRARGDKSADGSTVAAEEVVSGSFRNLSGTISSIDTTAGTVSLKDLATKKPFVIHIGPDAQLHQIPDRIAQLLAARLKGTAAANGPQGGGQRAGASDPGQLLNRMPAIQLKDLQKGEAVMIVATDGTNGASGDVNAITLLAGVEPLLEAPAARDLLSSWSMGGGDAGAAQ